MLRNAPLQLGRPVLFFSPAFAILDLSVHYDTYHRCRVVPLESLVSI